MSAAPPLRFLGLVLGGWVCARAAVLAPEWMTEEVQAEEAPLRTNGAASPATAAALPPPRPGASRPVMASAPENLPAIIAKETSHAPPPLLALSFASGRPTLIPASAPAARIEQPQLSPTVLAHVAGPALATAPPIATTLESSLRSLTVSGWAIVREGGGSQLAAGGVLGGSQIGARATYRLNPSLALSGRVSSPLERDGAEAAVGVEWQPSPRIPVKVLAERRQAIGDEGRSAFAVLAHGGVSGVEVAGPVTADAYAQVGVVGASKGDVFADGAVKLNLPVGGGVEVGAGAWGAAQPGVERLDIGPHVSLSLPGGGATITVAAEWRVRIAGDAAPGSGPALTLATDF